MYLNYTIDDLYLITVSCKKNATGISVINIIIIIFLFLFVLILRNFGNTVNNYSHANKDNKGCCCCV